MSIEKLFQQRQILLEEIKEKKEELIIISDIISQKLKEGGKILIAGNGGSAATASHFASEIVGKFKKVRRGYPAMSLTSDNSVLTALANDFGYEEAVAKGIEAHGSEKDLFIAISSSGNSENLIKALKSANAKQIYTISLLGQDGGKQKGIADIDFIVTSYDCAQVQELHLTTLHIIAEIVEKNLN